MRASALSCRHSPVSTCASSVWSRPQSIVGRRVACRATLPCESCACECSACICCARARDEFPALPTDPAAADGIPSTKSRPCPACDALCTAPPQARAEKEQRRRQQHWTQLQHMYTTAIEQRREAIVRCSLSTNEPIPMELELAYQPPAGLSLSHRAYLHQTAASRPNSARPHSARSAHATAPRPSSSRRSFSTSGAAQRPPLYSYFDPDPCARPFLSLRAPAATSSAGAAASSPRSSAAGLSRRGGAANVELGAEPLSFDQLLSSHTTCLSSSERPCAADDVDEA